jgi:hypothetical protein
MNIEIVSSWNSGGGFDYSDLSYGRKIAETKKWVSILQDNGETLRMSKANFVEDMRVYGYITPCSLFEVIGNKRV